MASVMSCHAMQKYPALLRRYVLMRKNVMARKILRVGGCGLLVGERMKVRVCECW